LIRYNRDEQRYTWDRHVHRYASQNRLSAERQGVVDRALVHHYAQADNLQDFSGVFRHGESAVNILEIVSRLMDSARSGAGAEHEDKEVYKLAYDIAHHAQRYGLEFDGRPLLVSVMRLCRQNLGDGGRGDPGFIAALLYDIAGVEQAHGELKIARHHYEESLRLNARERNDYGCARSLHGLGRVYHDDGNFSKAREHYEESMRLRRQGLAKHEQAIQQGRAVGGLHESLETIAHVQHELARLAHDEGRSEAAEQLHREALSNRGDDQRGRAESKYELGRLAQERGDWPVAEGWYVESEEHCRQADYLIGLGTVEHARASLLALRGHTVEAQGLFHACLGHQTRAGDKRGVATTKAQIAMLSMDRPQEAKRLFEESIQMHRDANSGCGEAAARIGLNLLRQQAGEIEDAERDLVALLHEDHDMSFERIRARVELELALLYARKIELDMAGDGMCSLMFDALMRALELATRSNDRCVLAAAKLELGKLARSVLMVESRLEADARRDIADLLGVSYEAAEAACLEARKFC
jgi:tetratricopeptide (TPR) repeat protein